jgi:aminobenzoyl-glutamate transport protein
MSEAAAAPKTSMQRFLDTVEKVGNMVPHPVVIFLILIGVVIVLSALLGVVGTAVTFEQINPDTHKVEKATTAIRSLLTIDGIRFMYSSLVPNFMSFTAVGLMGSVMACSACARKNLPSSWGTELVGLRELVAHRQAEPVAKLRGLAPAEI